MSEHPDDLFISYSGPDDPWVRQIAGILEERLFVETADGATREFKCFFYTRDIEPGEQFKQKMLARSNSALRLLVVVTPEAIASPYVRQEINSRLGDQSLDSFRFADRRPYERNQWFFQDVVSFNAYDDARIDQFIDALVKWLCKPRAEETHVVSELNGRAEAVETMDLFLAWQQVRESVGLVWGGGLIGCAVYNHGTFFVCPEEVAKAVDTELKGHIPVEIRWQSADAERGKAIRQTRSDERITSPSYLNVIANGANPPPPQTISVLNATMTFAQGCLGAVCSLGGNIVPFEITVHDWEEPDGVEWCLPETADLLPGSPVFDAAGRIAGFLARDSRNAWIAIPANLWLKNI